MNINIDLNTLILIVVGSLVTWVLKGITSINQKLSALNGRVGKSETWQEAHTKLDDERHGIVERFIEAIWNQIDKKI